MYSIMIEKGKRRAFRDITDKIRGRMQVFNRNWFSQAGKEVFMKVVFQALLAYSMSCFLFPKVLCQDINRLLYNY